MMLNKLWWNLIVLLYSTSVFSQEVLSPLHWQAILISPHFQQRNNPFSITVNPSALVFYDHNSWGISAAKRFSLPGWIQGNGVGILSTQSGNWGISAEMSGLEGFSRQQFNISHARQLFEGVALGLSMGVRAFKATGYKILIQPTASLGSFLELSNELAMGFSASTAFRVGKKRDPYGELNLQLLIHLQYTPSSKVIFSLWGLKKNDFSIEIGSTLSYQLHEKFSLVAGVSVDRNYSWLGISMARKRIIMNLQLGWHPMLGIGNNFSLYGNHQ